VTKLGLGSDFVGAVVGLGTFRAAIRLSGDVARTAECSRL
jgi:hypothetical protein